MNRFVSRRMGCAVLAAFMGLGIGAVDAGVPPDGPEQMEKAALALIEQAKNDATSAPRMNAPNVKDAFAALVDRGRIIGSAPYAAKDVEPLLSTFSGYFALTKVYMNFHDPSGKTSFADNEFTYQDELAGLAVAMIDTAGALSEALTDEVSAKASGDVTEQRKTEMAKLRTGISQMFSGALTILQNPRYSKENKTLIAASLAGNGVAFRNIIPTAERASIASAGTQTLLQTPPEAEADVTSFINDLKNEECTALCALK